MADRENSAGYLLDALTPDAHVLDVGCGPGTITVDLAARVPEGQVTGIDAADGVLDTARQEAQRRGQENVRFEPGNVYQLGYPDGTFDVVHAHQVLQHLSDPVAALAEMRRVCRPGGLVAARDGDYGGMFWYPAEPGSLSGRPCTAAWPGRWTASRTPGGTCWRGCSAGFEEIAASASAWCYAGPRGPAVVGRAVGAAADRIAVRRPGRRAGPGYAGRSGAAGPGLAALGGQRGRLVHDPARRGALPGLGLVVGGRGLVVRPWGCRVACCLSSARSHW